MIGLFLDDIRFPQDVNWIDYPSNVNWKLCRTNWDVVIEIEELNNYFDVISLDHDIACEDGNGNEITGYDVLKRIIQYYHERKMKLPMIVFHTQNPVGKENMQRYLNNYLHFVERGFKEK